MSFQRRSGDSPVFDFFCAVLRETCAPYFFFAPPKIDLSNFLKSDLFGLLSRRVRRKRSPRHMGEKAAVSRSGSGSEAGAEKDGRRRNSRAAWPTATPRGNLTKYLTKKNAYAFSAMRSPSERCRCVRRTFRCRRALYGRLPESAPDTDKTESGVRSFSCIWRR